MKKNKIYFVIIMALIFATGCGSLEKESTKENSVAEAVIQNEAASDQETVPVDKTFVMDEVTIPEQKLAYTSIETGYYEDGSLNYTQTVEYNAAGQELSYFYKAEEREFVYHTTSEYDEVGNLIYHTDYDESGQRNCVTQYQYGENGKEQLSCYCSYLEKGTWITWTEYEYDDKDNLIKRSDYDEEGNLECWWEYTYDNAGNQIKTVKYTEAGEEEACTECTYDSAGNMLSRLEKDGFYEGLFTEYQYDENGRVIHEKQADKNYGFFYEHGNEYDESGNRVYLTSYTEDGEIKGTQNWEYDDRGRVVKSTTYRGGEKPTSWYEIEYVENEVAEQ